MQRRKEKMNEKKVSQFSPPKLLHYGIVVRDMTKSVKFYEALGIGPFKPVPYQMKARKVFGLSDSEIKNKAWAASIGDTGIGVELRGIY
jgi:hypothetical protein